MDILDASDMQYASFIYTIYCTLSAQLTEMINLQRLYQFGIFFIFVYIKSNTSLIMS